MNFSILTNEKAVTDWIANHIISRINTFQPTEEKPFVLGLPTGSTALGVYANLVDSCKKGLVSFKHVHTFNMDEYVSLPLNHEQSYTYFMWNNLFSKIDIPAEQVHILNGTNSDVEGECRNFEKQIQDLGGIELFFGGIGTNGHLAFNEPGSPFSSTTRLIELTESTINANARFFNDDKNSVPKHALSVGLKTITDAKEVIVAALGSNKAEAINKIVTNGVSEKCPASILHLHSNSTIVCDKESASKLNAEDYKKAYNKNL